MTPRWRVAIDVLFGITIVNYVAQIPYYIHFYGIHHVAPSLLGVALLLITLLIFLAGYALTLRGRALGGWLLLGFLLVEFGFYGLHNLSGAFLNDLPVNDPLFLTVSLIGYANMLVALVYLIRILQAHQRFLHI